MRFIKRVSLDKVAHCLVTDTLHDCLLRLNVASLKLCLVLDEGGKLKGTITDGDCRRAFMNKCSIASLASEIMVRDFTAFQPGESFEHMKMTLITNRLVGAPVVNGRQEPLFVVTSLDDAVPIDKVQRGSFFIMAGGRGSRLRPLTDRIPKPMLCVGDKPMLEHIIIKAKNDGFQDFILSVNYKRDMVKDYFGDGSRLGVSIRYVEEKQPSGTAGSLGLISSDMINFPVVVSNADVLTNICFRSLVDHHASGSAAMTVAGQIYTHNIPYGVLEIDEDHLIKAITEKPVVTKVINTGLYVIDRTVVERIKPDVFYDMPDLINDLLTEGIKVQQYVNLHSWLDVGSIEQYERANQNPAVYIGHGDI